jgi:hypothetical protein
LIGKLNSKDKFKSTLRRMCLSYWFNSHKSNWLLYRLFKSDLFSIKDVIYSKRRISAQHGHYSPTNYGHEFGGSVCEFLPEILECHRVEHEICVNCSKQLWSGWSCHPRRSRVNLWTLPSFWSRIPITSEGLAFELIQDV